MTSNQDSLVQRVIDFPWFLNNQSFCLDFFSIMMTYLDNQFGGTKCSISFKSLELVPVLFISMKKDPHLIVAEDNMHKCCFCSF